MSPLEALFRLAEVASSSGLRRRCFRMERSARNGCGRSGSDRPKIL